MSTYASNPPGYDANALCEYLMGMPGNNIDSCNAFNYRVKEMIHSKSVTFTHSCLNVSTNPMLTHAEAFVSAVEKAIDQDLFENNY